MAYVGRVGPNDLNAGEGQAELREEGPNNTKLAGEGEAQSQTLVAESKRSQELKTNVQNDRGAEGGHGGDSSGARGTQEGPSGTLPQLEGRQGKRSAELLYWDKHIPRICLPRQP